MERLRQHPPEPEAPTVVATDDLIRGVAALHSFDPEFDVHLFLSAVGSIVTLIREAWNSNQPERALPLLEPGLARRWPQQWAAWQRQPFLIFNGVGLPHVVLANISTSEVADSIVTEVSLPSEPGAAVASYRQTWTFVRYRGDQQLTTFRCPACGAPYSREEGGPCRYCGAAVSGLAFSWLLAAASDGAPTHVPD